MDRNREARRGAASIVGSNGFNRRRHRTNSLRDSPDEDTGGVELQESANRLRERVKKDRDRDRERELRERSSRNHTNNHHNNNINNNNNNNNKRRRGIERLTNNNNRENELSIDEDDTSEESVNDEEDDEEYEDTTTTVKVSAHPSVSYSQTTNQNHNNHNHHNQNHQHRKSFPSSAAASSSKVFRAPPVWKSGDEMIGVPVPRKARSASTKRSHDWISSSSNNNSGGGVSGSETHGHRQPSSSPVSHGLVSTTLTTSLAAAPPMSPSSSNVSIRKKLKSTSGVTNNNSGGGGGLKLKPPKVSSNSTKQPSSSSNPEELEIEIAEVLYGLMTQSSKKDDSTKETVATVVNNRSSGDLKSRNSSSPISNSASAVINNSNNNNPILGSNSTTPLTAVAPKRKRPRHIPENTSFTARGSSVLAKADTDQSSKSEIPSPVLEKVSVGSITAENGFKIGGNLVNSQAQAVLAQPLPQQHAAAPLPVSTTKLNSEFKLVGTEELGENSSNLAVKEEASSSPKEKKASPAVRLEESSNRVSSSIATASSSVAASSTMKANSMGNQREEKFEIDLMAPPPQVRSSPERETDADVKAASMDQKTILSISDVGLKPYKGDDKGKKEKDRSADEEKKGRSKAAAEEGEGESHKGIEMIKERNIDLRLDLEKFERDGNDGVNANGNKLQIQPQKQQPQQIPVKATREEPPLVEKFGQSTNSLPLPMSMGNWPGGLPPMGYMAPLQGVVSMDGSTVTPAPIQPMITQPRPKRCATHCHIARNIHYLQQCMKMNPYWPATPGAPSFFGSKPHNLNVMPDMHGNAAVRGVNNNASTQDKGQSFANIPNHVSSKDKTSQPTATPDSAQRKQQQILIQQSIPPVPPNNLLGPAFIFPLNQQQAAVAAAARPSSGKSQTTVAASSSVASTTGGAGATTAPGGVATAMSFNFPNMAAANETQTQYLAILQNNGYPFPIPTVGAPPNYRPAPGQAMPLFNGSFYPSQMIHPSQLQHQQQPPPSQPPPQLLQAHPNNTSASNNSSSSQKHSQRPQSSNGVPGSSNLQSFSTQKSQPSQQQSHNQNVHSSRPRHTENEMCNEDSPSAGSRASMNIYGPNFAMPMHPQNFALMTQPSGAGNANQSEKKPLKPGVDSMPQHSFAMSFGPINGTGPGIDMASMAQNHAIFQTSPEAARQNMQMMAAAAAAASQVAQKKNFRMSEDNKSGGGDSSAMEDERKSFSAKAQGGNVGQSIAFARSDLSDSPITPIQANNVIESSTRSLNPSSGPTRSSRPTSTNAAGVNAQNVQNAQMQAQLQHQQQMMQQYKQQQQQQQMAANQSKVPVTSNGTMNSRNSSMNSSCSTMSAKFPSTITGFPQNLVPSNNNSSLSHSSQWKGSTTSRAPASQAPSTATALKNMPQQHSSKTAQPQMHTQISFGNQKPSTPSQGQQPNSTNQAPSPPMMVGSPTTSSMSKGAGGSPRTTNSASNNNKSVQASSFSSQQQNKNSPSIHTQKSPSVLGNPHTASSTTGTKHQIQQQQQQLQLHQMQQQQQQRQKTMQQQQAQLFFSNPYTQSQSPHSNSTSSNNSVAGGYYMQQRSRSEQQHQQSPGGASAASSTGGLSLSTSTNDPAKAIAAATSNAKGGGGGLQSQGIIHASQFAGHSGGTLLPAGFSYVHPVPAAVQAKPAEQKQPAGNDNLHAWQPEKK